MAIATAGSLRKLGDIVGLTRQAIHAWDDVPEDHAVKISEALGLPLEQLCPHLTPVVDAARQLGLQLRQLRPDLYEAA